MMDDDADRSLARRLGRLRRHIRWILSGAALCGLAALVISLFLPKIYRATTYILVAESKMGAAPQPAGWGYALLPTYVPFVDNDELIARAIQHFHLDREPYRLTPDRFRRNEYLDVQIPKSTRLLEIKVTFPDARTAADLANYLAQAAVELNDRMNSADTQATQKILKERLDQATAHLQETEARRLEVRKRTQIEDEEKELNILLTQKEQLSNQLEQFRIGLAQDESKAKALGQALAGEPRTLSLKKSVTSDRFLERAVEKLHPEDKGVLSTSEETLNVTREEFQRQFVDSTAKAAAERAGFEAATARLAQVETEINRVLGLLTLHRNEIDQAERNFVLAREVFESASRDYRNASVTVSSKSQDLKQVAPALIPERPAKPKILLNTLLGLVMGLALLSGVALGIESLRETPIGAVSFIPEDEPMNVHRS